MGIKTFFKRLIGATPEQANPVPEPEKGEDSPYAKLVAEDAPDESQGRPKVRDAFVFEGVQPIEQDTVVLFYPDQSLLLIRHPDTGYPARYYEWKSRLAFRSLPVFGDWTGSGHSVLGLFDVENAAFSLFHDYDEPVASTFFYYGPPGYDWIPLAGDWDGDGKDGIGLYDPTNGVFMLRNELIGAPPEMEFAFGPANQGWIPLVGDWNGDKRDEVAVYNPKTGEFLLSGALPLADVFLRFETANVGEDWRPLAGDWRGFGFDCVGLFDTKADAFHLLNPLSKQEPEIVFRFGVNGVSGVPFSIKWTADLMVAPHNDQGEPDGEAADSA